MNKYVQPLDPCYAPIFSSKQFSPHNLLCKILIYYFLLFNIHLPMINRNWNLYFVHWYFPVPRYWCLTGTQIIIVKWMNDCMTYSLNILVRTLKYFPQKTFCKVLIVKIYMLPLSNITELPSVSELSAKPVFRSKSNS